MKVTSLHYYPVKSMQGIALNSIKLDDFGIQGDRRFMLIDQSGKFVTQRKHPILSKFSATILSAAGKSGLTISAPGIGDVSFDIEDFSREMDVVVWGDCVKALAASNEQSREISRLLNLDVSLVYMPNETFRQVDRDFFAGDQRVSFADAFPLLLASEASLNDLNEKLDTPVPMGRFRPNIVIDGLDAFAEDGWKKLRIGQLEFDCVKPCSRCIMTTVDENSKTGVEPLRTLATYRKNEFGVCFGENLVHRSLGTITVGDDVIVLD